MKLYLFFGIAFLLSCKADDGFIIIPTDMHNEDSLIKQIIPKKKFTYWECIFKDMSGGKSKVVINFGDSTTIKNLLYKVPEQGFLTKMWSGHYYIAYVENDSLKYITTNNQLKQFIGGINNLEEALLVAKTYQLDFSNIKKIGGAYKKSNNGFELYLTKYHNCPYKEEAFEASIDLQGNFKFKSQNIFFNVDEGLCID